MPGRSRQKVERGLAIDYEHMHESLWLIVLFTPAVGFMLWVLWNLHKQINRERRRQSGTSTR